MQGDAGIFKPPLWTSPLHPLWAVIKGPRFQIVKQFFPMAASGSLAGGTGSWPCCGRPSKPATWWGSAGRAPSGPGSCSAGTKGQSLCTGLWAGSVRQYWRGGGRGLSGRGHPSRKLVTPNLPAGHICMHLLLDKTSEVALANRGWGWGKLDDHGTIPRKATSIWENEEAAQKEEHVHYGSLYPWPGQRDSSCSSPATAVFNKNNRNKLSPHSSSYFPLIMAYIYIFKIEDFKNPHQESLYCVDWHPYLNFINI